MFKSKNRTNYIKNFTRSFMPPTEVPHKLLIEYYKSVLTQTSVMITSLLPVPKSNLHILNSHLSFYNI
jgi:hypothetical protein